MLRIYTEEHGESVLFARMLLLTLRYDGQKTALGGDPKEADLLILDADALRQEQIEHFLETALCVLYTAGKEDLSLRYPDCPVFVRPFSMEDFCEKIRQICKKAHAQDMAKEGVHLEKAEPPKPKTASEELTFTPHGVMFRQQPLHLTAKETEVLQYLYTRRGKVCTREEILQDLWGYPQGETATNVVDVYIRYLRKKIDQTFDVRLLRSVRGQGYLIL